MVGLSFFVGWRVMNDQSQADLDKKKRDPEQILYNDKSDTFSFDEQKRLVSMMTKHLESDLMSMKVWIDQRVTDLMMYDGERPSKIENLSKKDWMSDRNLGLVAANCDASQATLTATCYNIDMMHFTATEENDSDRKDALEKFAKWGLGEKEADFQPEVEDFIHNKVTQGISYFYTHWVVKYVMVDRRIPRYDPVNPKKVLDYEIKTELVRFERGVIENISDVSDLIFPEHGKTLQDKHHLIHRLHMTAKDLIDGGKNGTYVDVDEEFVGKLKKYCFDNSLKLIGEQKLSEMGIAKVEDISDDSLEIFPIEVFAYYGTIAKENGYEEEYRILFEPQTKKFLSGKPLRKINRRVKRPFVGRPLIRKPGIVQGKSLPRLIGDAVNAFNNVFNQKTDFQYAENCPSGSYNPDEAFKDQEQDLVPGVMYPTADPDSVVMHKTQRSMAWAQIDYEILLEIIERLTGAASYFMSNQKGVSGTATRDAIINEKSETRFGSMVNRIILDIVEAITMWVEMYQDWAPPSLGERILGDNGKKLFENFSPETIRGGYEATISPDIISGSKTLEKEIAMAAFELLVQSPWMNPMMNPKGSWKLTVDTAKKIGLLNADKYMLPEPDANFVDLNVVKDKWSQIKQGTTPELKPGEDIMSVFMGLSELNETKREELDPEYQPLLDAFLFTLNVSMMKEMQRLMNEAQANRMAMGMVNDVEQGRMRKQDFANQ